MTKPWAGVILHIYDIKNNAWVPVNNDFFVTGEVIRQWFSRVTKSRVKIIAESPHECIILFLTRFFMSWTDKSAKNYHPVLISPLLLRAVFSDLALWYHHNWSVTLANMRYWYCDVIFIDCHCMRKLVQRRSSLVNNSREYRYPATRYSQLSV